jgi:hypothetical protein
MFEPGSARRRAFNVYSMHAIARDPKAMRGFLIASGMNLDTKRTPLPDGLGGGVLFRRPTSSVDPGRALPIAGAALSSLTADRGGNP